MPVEWARESALVPPHRSPRHHRHRGPSESFRQRVASVGRGSAIDPLPLPMREGQIASVLRKHPDIIVACPGAVEIEGRGEAIAAAIAELRDDDLLLIAGKGHEQGQSIAGQMIPFDDGEVARRAVLAQSLVPSRISP